MRRRRSIALWGLETNVTDSAMLHHCTAAPSQFGKAALILTGTLTGTVTLTKHAPPQRVLRNVVSSLIRYLCVQARPQRRRAPRTRQSRPAPRRPAARGTHIQPSCTMWSGRSIRCGPCRNMSTASSRASCLLRLGRLHTAFVTACSHALDACICKTALFAAPTADSSASPPHPSTLTLLDLNRCVAPLSRPRECEPQALTMSLFLPGDARRDVQCWPGDDRSELR